MKNEKLQILDTTFMVNRTIRQAPHDTLVREFVKNADENTALIEADQQRIDIYPVDIKGVRKLAFYNTGIGMNANELKIVTNLSSSINKKMGLDGNFGIGAKVSGLAVSPHGIRYRSCKNGVVNQITIGYDEEDKTYVRFRGSVEGGAPDSVFDVTEIVESEGYQTKIDWTEVVLFGEAANHDTVSEPTGMGKKVDRSFIPSSIFRRFAELESNAEIRVDVAMTKGGRVGETGRTRRVKLLEEVLIDPLKHGRVDSPDGRLTVHYIHDPKHPNSSQSLSSRANPATASTTFCALVYKGERYDHKTKKAWSSVAPNFGIAFGSTVLTIEIELPNGAALPNQYRNSLTWPDDKLPMLAEDYAHYVRELMPLWVLDVIRAESPATDDNLSELEANLQKLLDRLRVPKVALTQTRRNPKLNTNEGVDGMDTTAPTNIDTDFDNDAEPHDLGIAPEHLANLRAKPENLQVAPLGAKPAKSSNALERVPKITILDDIEKVKEKDFIGRAARYYTEGEELFINGNYPIVERMAAELEAELRPEGDPDVVREAVLNAARLAMAYRVGKHACFAISKRPAEDWTSDDLEKAITPEALSMAADDYMQSMKDAKKMARNKIKSAELV